MRRALALLLALAAPAFADDDATRPYDLRVVVRVAPHRLLTAGFRRQFTTELQDGLQAGLGLLASVKVVDANETPDAWLEPESLDAHSAVGPTKRHFVRVEFVEGRYTVAARQLDGATGLASPVVRRAQTSDRAYVGRLALRFIDMDFGVTAAVANPDGDRVRLTFQGSALPGIDWGRRVPKGTVFAVADIVDSPPRGRLRMATFLQAQDAAAGGGCDCQLVSRYLKPLAVGGPFRAIALGATQGPLKLRFVDADGLPHQNLLVKVSDKGFAPGDAIRDRGAVRDGNFVADGPYDRLAFVRVEAADRGIPIPVAILDDRVVVSEVRVAAGDEARQQVEIDARNVRLRFVDIVKRLEVQNGQLQSLLKATRNQEALGRVQGGLKTLNSELAALSAEMIRLRTESSAVDANVSAILDDCGQFLAEVTRRRDSLGKAEADLQKAVEAETSPEAQAKKESFLSLLVRADKQREDADIEGALATYEEVLQKHGDRPEVREKLTKLQAEWKIKGPEHQTARTFTYGQWSKVKTLDELHAALPKAKEALDALRTAGDKLTGRKLFLVATQAVNVVEQATEEASKLQSDDAKLTLRKAQLVGKDLEALIKAAFEFTKN